MDIKTSEEKLWKLITNVSNALNASNKKISAKINDLMGEISEVKEDLESMRNIIKEKCECDSDLKDLRNYVKIAENVFKEINIIESEIKKIQYNRMVNLEELKDINSKLNYLKDEQVEMQESIAKNVNTT